MFNLILNQEDFKKEGYEYIWMDMLCINQLLLENESDQINIMGEIFKKSKKCFVFPGKLSKLEYNQFINLDGEISEWFGKVWTLQEAVKSRELLFWDAKRNKWYNKQQIYWMLLQIGPFIQNINQPYIDIHTA
ncbi:hypothetical protein K492DRAFT_170182, partial [Lichtheimia hyalospora FSU 10163]